MFVLGITGPSGAGKGTACEILQEFGFYHIDTDRLVPGIYPKAMPQLIKAFGPQVAMQGNIDKKELAKAAFSSPQATDLLNGILHPLVMDEVKKQIKVAENSGFSCVTVDGAALHEAHAELVCDKILCILAPKDHRLSRVMKRDSITQEAASLRFEAQRSDEYYASRSDAVIINQTVEQLKRDLSDLMEEWKL